MKANMNQEENMDEEDDDNWCSTIGIMFLSVIVIVGAIYALARYTDVSDETGTYGVIFVLAFLAVAVLVWIIIASSRHNQDTFATNTTEHQSHERYGKID
jgi:uncharacterized sodium:solute symporter family permease YidK